MGFNEPHPIFGAESDVIIGLLDTGEKNHL